MLYILSEHFFIAMVAHVYTEWYTEKHGHPPEEIPSIYTKDSLILRIQRRLNTVWELRTHRIYQYLGIPMKARSKDEDEKEERLRSFKSYVKAGGLIKEVSKLIIFIGIFHFTKSIYG